MYGISEMYEISEISEIASGSVAGWNMEKIEMVF
jgi:hypothetical protein